MIGQMTSPQWVLARAAVVHVITDILYTMASEEESVTADP